MFTIISGGRNSGKTTYLREVLKDEGSKVFGYLADKVYQDQRVVGYRAKELISHEEILLVHDTTEFQNQFSNKRFHFNCEGYNYCCNLLKQAMKTHDTLVIDEIGKLELTHKKGYWPILKELAQSKLNIYVTVRDALLPELTSLLNEYNHPYEVVSLKSVGAILLASGDSRRFGKENKLLSSWKGHTLFEEVLLQVIGSGQCSHTVVVSRYEEIRDITNKYEEVTYIQNDHWKEGISASIRLGTEYLQTLVQGYMFVQSDQVGIKSDTIKLLAQSFKDTETDVIMPRYDGVIASPKIFSSNLTSELLNLKGDNGARGIVKCCMSKEIIDIEDTTGILDIDTKEDLHHMVNWHKESGDHL